MKEKSVKSRVVILSILLLGIFVLLDRILLPNVLFEVPNEMEWDTSPWYNFLEKRDKIRFSSQEKGVLLVGSSVALYSELPERMNEYFNTRSEKENIRTEFYAHPALTPSDLYRYKEDIISKKPKLVFYVLNPADLQLDFLISSEEEKKRKEQYEKNIFFQEKEILDPGKIEYSEEKLVQVSSKIRHQNRMIYPGQYLYEKFSSILKVGKSAVLSLLSRSFFLVVRYRSFLYDPFDAMIENHLRSGRSYHYYTGIQPKEGIYLRGWAKPEFTIDCELKNGVLQESVFFQEKNTNLKIKNSGGDVLFDKTFPKSGWHNIRLEFPGNSPKPELKFQTDKQISSNQVDSRLFGTEEIYGIRLSQNFCRKEIRKNIAYLRIPGLDDSRIAKLDDPTYDRDYKERIYGYKTGVSMSRLVTLRMAKLKLASSPSFFGWSETEYLQKTIRYLGENGVQVIVVNSPENPIESEVYKQSPWYLGYVSFLENLGKERYHFQNAAPNFNNKKDFFDPHHLTYEASEKASDLYSGWISEVLKSEN